MISQMQALIKYFAHFQNTYNATCFIEIYYRNEILFSQFFYIFPIV